MAPNEGDGVATYLEAIRQALWEEMERDPRVFLMGEDIGEYGGAFKVTEGFLERFGAERIVDTPIVESGMVGAAAGAALMGQRPVVEMQFIDFIANAFDQLVNFVAKSHWRWGQPMPLVVRGPCGAGVRGGPFHSQSPEGWFHHVPGLKIVQPATAYDAKGLLKAAIRDPDPVLYLEHKMLYRRTKGELPAEDYEVPIGKAEVRRQGSDITIVTYGAMLHRSLEAAEKLAADGVEAEVVDLRTLLPLDDTTVMESVRRTSKVVIVHEDTLTGGIGAEIAARIADSGFEHLDGPVRRVASRDCAVPFSAPLEDAFMPQVEDIQRACGELVAY
ncbi:MAG: alpha-ketoacid dehydrogenase subunit beta [Candidatus Latescibacterota bacterium]|nr:MAG: alpha-ketoacid dehydrogenase subunit beta [Candidatus Latescibacterota bacterium]